MSLLGKSAEVRKNHHVQFNQAKKILDEVKDFLISPVLDIGCGDGDVTSYLSSLLKGDVLVIGIDKSPDFRTFGPIKAN